MWTDFFICLFFGCFGVHRFRKKQIGLGILYLLTFGLFGVGWLFDSIIYLLEALIAPFSKKETPKIEVPTLVLEPDGSLPIVIDTSVILRSGELCHFSQSATRLIPKNKVVGYTSGSTGMSVRVAKGVTVRTGGSKGEQIRENVLEEYSGRLIITNKRIIFSSLNNGFEKNIAALSMVTPADDGLVIQFGSQSFMIETKNAKIAHEIILHITSCLE